MARRESFRRRLTDWWEQLAEWLTDWWCRLVYLDWWAPIGWATLKRWVLLGLLLALLAGAGYLLYTIVVFGWPIKSGLDEFIPPQPKPEGYEREKTLWDWLQLLIIPIVLAIGGFFFSRAERMSAEKAAQQRDETERKIADQRAQDAVLETYLDQMAELLIDHNLRKSEPDDEVRDIARIRTLTALRRLDGNRNHILLQFLHDAGLFRGQSTPIISMDRADLRGVSLQSANLQGVDLYRANLYGATLGMAALQGANLQRTVLIRADLFGADLRETDLREADLRHANLEGANLEGANLKDANLKDANLKDANLQGATMPDGSRHE